MEGSRAVRKSCNQVSLSKQLLKQSAYCVQALEHSIKQARLTPVSRVAH